MEPVRAVRLTDCYSQNFHDVRYNRSVYIPRARDKVRISEEAVEMFNKLSTAGSNLTQEGKPGERNPERNTPPLHLDENASRSEIRAAYIEAIKKYHPDRYMGFPPEVRQFAEEKTKEINSAYSRLMNIH